MKAQDIIEERGIFLTVDPIAESVKLYFSKNIRNFVGEVDTWQE